MPRRQTPGAVALQRRGFFKECAMTLHLQHADDPPRPDPLAQSLRDKLCASGTARFFAEMWENLWTPEAYAPDPFDIMVRNGLAEWIGPLDPGLTDAGRAAVEAAQAFPIENF
jgi:hypothetical protein